MTSQTRTYDPSTVEQVVKDRFATLPDEMKNSPEVLVDWAITNVLQQINYAGQPSAAIQRYYNLAELTQEVLDALGEMTPRQYVAYQMAADLPKLEPVLKGAENVWHAHEVRARLEHLKAYKLRAGIK